MTFISHTTTRVESLPSDWGPSLTSLLVPREELRRRLQDRVRAGNELADAAPAEPLDGDDVAAYENRTTAWHDHNRQLICGAFSDDSEVETYDRFRIAVVASPADDVAADRAKVIEGIGKLESLLGRLELFPEEVMVQSSSREQRDAYLRLLFERTRGRSNQVVSSRELGSALGFSESLCSDVEDYLHAEGLIEFVSMGPMVSLTHKGRIYCEGHQGPTTAAAPMTSGQIVQIFGDVNDSNIGVAGGDVRQQHVGIDESTKEELNDYLTLVAKFLDSAQLDDQLRAAVEANAQTLQSQMASPAPDRGILRRSVEVVQRVAENAAGGLAANALLVAGAKLVEHLA